MTPDRLLAHFDRLADAPDAILRLRRFTLDLAVRGKLVEQDPDDEPADVLIRRVHHHEKSAGHEVQTSWDPVGKMAAENKIEAAAPPGWAVGTFGRLLELEYGKGLPATKRDGDGSVAVYGSNGVVGHHTEALTQSPAIIVGRKGSAGALNIAHGPSWTTDVAYFIVPPKYFDLRFLYAQLQTLGLDTLSRGVKPGLSRADANALTMVIPPLAEQHRIVAKVDELMALCDQVEAAQKEREERRDRLAAASLQRLSMPADDNGGDSLRDNARFHLNLMPRLVTRPEHVKGLRHTILNLAVRGKLVPQDPNDEPAASALRRARADQAITVRKGRRDSVSTREISSAAPGAIPQSWMWVATETVCEAIVDCPHSTPKFVTAGVVCLDTNSFKGGRLIPAKLRYVTEADYEERTRRTVPQPGDIVFAREGSVGESVIVPVGMKCCLGQRVMLFRPLTCVVPEYFNLAISEPSSLSRLMAHHKGIGARHVNVADMRRALVALPPLPEQRRIVARVDVLMAICDQLEAQFTSAQDTSRRLLDAVLHEALAPAEREIYREVAYG